LKYRYALFTRELAAAGRGGVGAEQVPGLNERFLEMIREAVFSDEILTTEELLVLERTSAVLAAPGYFDDLVPTAALIPAVAVPGVRVPTSEGQRVRKCGHSRKPGQYRSKCSELS
jgi:DNA polymerase III subunit epsilon